MADARPSPTGGVDVEYALISDVHLTEVAEGELDGWWEYKSAQASQDGALVGLLEALETHRPERFARTRLILNGDTFDFDSVFSGPGGGRIPTEGLPFTMPASVFKMRRLLDDHPAFVVGLARFLAAGNRVTFVMGNHDRELVFAEVQEVLVARLAAAAPPGDGAIVARAVSFEPWFVHVPGTLYAEHGNQYDTTCAYRDLLDPTIPADRKHPKELEANFGSVISRHLLSRMGTFNPFNDESFVLSFKDYMKHYGDHYMRRRKPFFSAYARAIAAGGLEVRRLRKRALRGRPDGTATRESYLHHAAERGLDEGFVALTGRLASVPIADRLRLMLHELWVDRFGLMFLCLALFGVGAFNVRTVPQGLLLIAFIPVMLMLTRMMGRGSVALQERGRWGLVAEQLASHVGVPIVAFGHSHRPERRPLVTGGRYYNLGSWAPVTPEETETTLGRARRVLIVRPLPGRPPHVVFQRWQAGEFTRF